LQPFTHSKDAATRAVLKVRATGTTGLNDALVRVTRDLSGRVGKKVIVVFTDGADNASGLTTDAVTLRAKMAGIPIYTIAHGAALHDITLLRSLETIAHATGALAFAIRTPSEISGVFEHVSQDIEHGYYFAFQPAPGETHAWRSIEIQLRNNPLGRKVRAREGYYTD
jgi:VWFA-related protein